MTVCLPTMRLPTSLPASISAGIVLDHGRLQHLNNGAVVADCSLDLVQPEWRPADRFFA